MNTQTMTYSFMDLLKDHNYVPKTDHGSNDFISSFKDFFERTNGVAADYNFMDLLNDHGQVPVIVEKENSIMLEIENGLSTVAEFIGKTTADYDFLNLLQDKGYGLVAAPFAANDNQLILRQVS